jgi:DNA polymerase I-like protein with 3'-5' exonuclease and polymerase domains
MAAQIKRAYFQTFPDFQELMNDVSARGEAGLPVKTWGGRLIYTEPAKMMKSKRTGAQYWATFEYKLTNYLIQGSAADQTKEAINTCGYRTSSRRFLGTVHDENVFSVKPDKLRENLEEIKFSMEKQEGWDVPFKAKAMFGPDWHNLKEIQ